MEYKKHGTPQAAITTRSPPLHNQYTRNRIPAIGSVVVENQRDPTCSHLPTGGHHRRTMPTYGEVLLAAAPAYTSELDRGGGNPVASHELKQENAQAISPG